MRKRQPGQHLNKFWQWMRSLRRFPWWLRLSIAIITLIAIIFAVITGVQNSKALGNDSVTNKQFIFSLIISLLGIAISVFQYFFAFPSFSEDKSINSQAKSTPQQWLPDWMAGRSGSPNGDKPLYMPYQRNPFFIKGYRDVVKELHDKFKASKAMPFMPPKAISGMSGIGKTQVAVEYAYRYYDEYQAILWANADSREALVSDLVNIADCLDLDEKDAKDQNETINAVKLWLQKQKNWLLILDNADDWEMVKDFIPLPNKGHILMTIHAESVGRLDGIEMRQMELEDGALFLLRRIRFIAMDALLEQASAEDVMKAKKIVEIMGGLPLALDQAAAFIDDTKCGLSGYLELYQVQRQRIKLLKWRSKSSSDHPEPVATTWSLSFKRVQKVNRAAADLLRFCAFLSPDAIPEEIFTGGGSELGRHLRTVTTDLFELNITIEELGKYSLVHRNPDQKTLTIHRLVQTVLKESMWKFSQRRWAIRTVRAIDRVFPQGDIDYNTFYLCRRCLPHVQACANLIEQWDMKFPEATRLLNQAGLYLQERGQYVEAEPFYQRALAIREKVLGQQHLDTASSLDNLAELYRAQGKYTEAEPRYKQALTIREKALGKEHPDTAQSLNHLAQLYQEQGKYTEAEPRYKQALAVLEKALGSQDPDTAQSLNDLAALYREQGKYAEAEPLFQRALAIREKALGVEHPDTANTLNHLAVLYHQQGKYNDAESFYQRALVIRKKVLGVEHPDTASTLNNLAGLYHQQGKYNDAEPLFQQVLEIRKKLLGMEHAETAQSLNNLAELYRAQGEYTKAEPFYQQALLILKKALGEGHPSVALGLNNLGLLYYNQGKYTEAESSYQQALVIIKKAFGSEHHNEALILNNLGILYYNQGKYTEAESSYQQALAIREKVLGPEHSDTALSLNSLAKLYSDQKKYPEAEQYFKKALASLEKSLGPDHPNVAKVLRNYANLLHKMNREDEAVELEARARAIETKNT